MDEIKDKSPELLPEFERALGSGHFMVAIWHIDDREVRLWRMTKDYPVVDFETSIELLKNDLFVESTTNTKRIVPRP